MKNKYYNINTNKRGKMNILITINAQYINQLNILLNSIQKSNRDEKFNVYILNRDLNKKQIKEIEKGLNLEK